MNRRQTLSALSLAAIAAPSFALAQASDQNRPSAAEGEHITATLDAGKMTLEASRVALSKATDPAVKRFAQLEAAEQETVAEVFSSRVERAQNAPPKVDAEAKSAIDSVHAQQAGPAFDKAYLAGQMEGHRKLLAIQEAYLSNGRDPRQRGLAMLMRGHIKEHILELEVLQKDMA